MNIERLKELLFYNQCDGVFVWNKTRNGKAKAGDVAGTLSYANSAKYISIMIDGKHYKAHRLAWLYMYGSMPNGVIDHVNGDTLDNRIENLRDVSQSCNRKNSKLHTNCKIDVQGVHMTSSGKWSAVIWHRGKKIYIGTFDDLNGAKKARKEAEVKYGYHSNHGRLKAEALPPNGK